MKRHRDALAIWGGACNPSGVANSIMQAQREIFDAGGGTDAVTGDPAVALMVYQLAFLCGMEPLSYDCMGDVKACEAAIATETLAA